jgi:carbamoyl-phosphate synthase large subunit
MKSTGEVMGVDTDYSRALYKAMVAAGIQCPAKGNLLVTIADPDKREALPIVEEFIALGFRVFATRGTARFLQEHGLEAIPVYKISEGGSPNLLDLIRGRQVDLLINTLTRDRQIEREGLIIRRASVDQGIPCLTSLDTARALLKALESLHRGDEFSVRTVDEYAYGMELTPA